MIFTKLSGTYKNTIIGSIFLGIIFLVVLGFCTTRIEQSLAYTD